ncbi:unnamed protein product [Malus baccata var. baccata]
MDKDVLLGLKGHSKIPQSGMMKLITAYLDQIMFLIDETPYFPFFTSLLVCILVIFWKRSRAGGLKSPPGPWKLPVIGNLHQMVGPLPHHTLGDLAKKHGPVMYLKLGQLEAVIISSAKAAQEVLKTHELTFAQRPMVLAAEVMSFGQASIFFARYGDLWRSLRKICMFELLSAKRVQSFGSVREEEVWNLVETIGSMSHKRLAINFRDRCCSFTNDVEFLSLLDQVIKLGSGFDIPDLFPSLSFLGFVTGSIPALKDIKRKIGTILENIINDHKIKRSKMDLMISSTSTTTAGKDKEKEEEEEDFVDVLLKLKESNKVEYNFTTSQIKDIIMMKKKNCYVQDIFSAGSETSAATLEWAMSELMRNPRIMKRAQAEVRQSVLQFEGKKRKVTEERDVKKMDYLKSVVKETLRLHAPGPLLPREARDTVQIGGFKVPVKSKLIINVWAIGRDPEIWGADAECFKPERFHGSPVDFKGFDFEFTPFGAGRRICPGMSFGVNMIELALAELLYRFDWKLANGMNPDELDMTESFGLSCRKKNALYVIATPHFTSLGDKIPQNLMMKVITAYLNQIMFLIVETPYFSFFTSLLVCILVIFWKRSRARGLKSPPGPWKLPIIGNLHQMVGPLPHHTLRDLAKKHGPIMHLKLGQLDAVIISSAKAAREVLKTHELAFAQRPIVLAAEAMSFGQGGIIFAPYGDLWRSLRKICIFELLSAKRVQSFRSVREEEVRNLMESIGSMSHKGLAINFSARCCCFANDVVGFDIPDLFPSLSFLGFVTGSIPALKDIQSKLGKILENIINDHMTKRSKKDLMISSISTTTVGNDKAEEGEEENFVDVLLKLKESNKAEFNFTTNQIKDIILDIFGAGSETSATTLEWAMSELMRNPRIMKRAQAEVRQLVLQFEGKKNKVIEERDVQKMDYLKSVVKETLRLHSPAPLLPREARDTVQISGFDVPVKSKVIINLCAIGRDPEMWGADAECFMPERFHGSSVDFKGFDFEFIPFGAGRRICPGMSFGVTTIELALAELLYRFDWKLANGMNPDELDMAERFGLSCRRKNALYRLAKTMNKTCTRFEYGRGGRWEPDAKAGSASRFYTLTMLKLSIDNAFTIVLNLD